MSKLRVIGDLQEFEHLLDGAKPKVHFFGGRYVEYKGRKYTLNFLVKVLRDLYLSKEQQEKIIQPLANKVRHLDEQAQVAFKQANLVRKIFTYIRQYFGNLFFNRNHELTKLEFPGKTPATSNGTCRLIELEGERGKVACKVRGDGASPFPKFSSNGGSLRCNWSVGSHLRLRNLIAVRGGGPRTRMIGPADYFGDIENPHKSLFTIDINDKGIPVILREEMAQKHEAEEKAKLDPSQFTSRVTAKWHKGADKSSKAVLQKYQSNDQSAVGPSLFPNAGILEIYGEEYRLKLKKVDARSVDLSSFKARLVHNQTPFQITSEKLAISDEYRAVSYCFEPEYAQYQVEKGGGLFLEQHQFAQTITPLDAISKGFVTLARWSDVTHLDIIGIEIPFGYTLIIDKDSIHGDSHLNGMFMMCMTSNHVTMSSADTVFLKHAQTKQNVAISIESDENQSVSDDGTIAPRPIVTYGGKDKKAYSLETKRYDQIFTYPFLRSS